MHLTADIFKYKLNRKLKKVEHENQLFIKEQLPVEPCDTSTIIELNSNYMETTDWRFEFKGLNSATAVAFFILNINLLIGIYSLGINILESPPATVIIYLCPTLMMGLSVYILRKEAFSYTHNPIRLDRKNRMVHVFRQDGSVLSTPWDSIFFCAGRGNAFQHEIQGHIFHEETETIRETFCLAHTESREHDNVLLLPYWELIRRYMEEGPEHIIEHVRYCPVIADRHENLHNYWQYRTYYIKGKYKILQILLFVDLLIYPFRWFAMRTSKIPVWPQHIQQQCVVDPDDPYIRNAGTNQI